MIPNMSFTSPWLHAKFMCSIYIHSFDKMFTHLFQLFEGPKLRLTQMCTNILPFSLSSSLWLYSPSDLGRFFSFLILYTVDRTPSTEDQAVVRPPPTHDNINTEQTQKDIHA
jgi:hypothetical protein